jgi:hypothetical protein
MIEWIKQTVSKIPESYGNVLLFNTLIGLRPDESTKSIKLLKSGAPNYHNTKNNTLEHFHYLDIFLRRTKNCTLYNCNYNIDQKISLLLCN